MLTETQMSDVLEIAHLLEKVDQKYLPMIATGVFMLLARDQVDKEKGASKQLLSNGYEWA